jgi:hypothetical protein
MYAIATSRVTVLVAIAITCLGAAISRSRLNALLQLFADVEPSLWEKAGQPSGLFGLPRGGRFFARDPAVDWLFATPDWVSRSAQARRILAAARTGALVTVLGLAILVGVVAWNS